jgi:hemolysin activation/secretion protein
LTFRALAAAALLAGAVGVARAQDEPPAELPSFAALEQAGAVIGEIRIVAEDIFDLDDPAENNGLFRLANRLHIQTRPGVIRGQLLFRSGERLVAQRIEETERLLRGNGYLYEASIRPVRYRDGVVDLEVSTRDTWSIETGASIKYAGSETSSGVRLSDVNFLGTGMRVGISTHSTSEVSTAGGARYGVNLDISYPYAFDGRTQVAYAQSSFSDGDSAAFSATRPFYALDARGAGNFSVSQDNRLYTRYADGAQVGRFRRHRQDAEFSGGWSPGLLDRWAHRFTLGTRFTNEQHELDPVAPAPLPQDRTLLYPFFRYEAVEDNFRETSNVQTIGRPEYLALGLQASVELGRSTTGFGSTQAVTRYAASISKGVRFSGERTLLAATGVAGEYANGDSDRVTWNGSLRYYQRRGSGALLYAALSADATDFSDAAQYLSLGGDTGLRGYPANYRLGDRRVLLTLEQRLYSDWYPFRLIRVGGALFYDLGRAWGGPYQNVPEPHWYDNVGFGLRLLSARSSSGTTLHIDFAFPVGREAGVDRYQITIESKTGF